MARLNDVPAPAPESLEAVKRRFIRQNREIARINSNQSMRIRNLETEISRLLAENIAIREEAISAKAEAEKWRASYRLNKEVVGMKSQLESKLSEVTALVEELGALPDKLARRSSHKRRREGFVSELVKTSEEREPRSRQTNPEQEGRLPAILEDKCYPRKTLEQEEVKFLAEDAAGNSLESPDLGPPPIAHFDESEPLNFDAAKSPRRTSTELIEESEKTSNTVSTNIEIKRKRRTSSLLNLNDMEETIPRWGEHNNLTNSNTTNVRQIPIEAPVRSTPTQRAGAKRKLEMSELEDTSKNVQESDDFVFHRKLPNVAAVRSSRFSRATARASDDKLNIEQPRSPDKPCQPARRILAPKSTNSPAKKLPVTNAEKGNINPELIKEYKPERRVVSRVRTRPTKIDISVLEPPTSISEFIEDKDPPRDPKTPGDDLTNILSPASIDPPSRHEPKEMTITNSVEDVLNGSIGRGSRRARAAVSYAPPKLNTKLRREGKELVGAVEGISKITGNGIQPHIRSNSEDPKQNEGAPNSASKTACGMRRDGQRRVSDIIETNGRSEPVSPTVAHRDIVERQRSGSPAVDEAIHKLSIYDHPESPVAGKMDSRQKQSLPDGIAIEPKLRAKRHSSVPDIPNTDDLVKGHARAGSASKLSGVPQRSARRGGTVDSSDLDASDVGGLRTRTSVLTHRRSMLV